MDNNIPNALTNIQEIIKAGYHGIVIVEVTEREKDWWEETTLNVLALDQNDQPCQLTCVRYWNLRKSERSFKIESKATDTTAYQQSIKTYGIKDSKHDHELVLQHLNALATRKAP